MTLVFLHSRLKLYCKYLPFFFPFDVFRNSVQITRHIVKNNAPKHFILTYANMLLRHQYGGRLICICCDVTWKPRIDRPGKYWCNHWWTDGDDTNGIWPLSKRNKHPLVVAWLRIIATSLLCHLSLFKIMIMNHSAIPLNLSTGFGTLLRTLGVTIKKNIKTPQSELCKIR